MTDLESLILTKLGEHATTDGTPAGECGCGWEYDGLGVNLRAHLASVIAEAAKEAECQALGCPDRSITTFTDGGGRSLDLCEHHGDQLAAGFALKNPVRAIPLDPNETR